MQIVQGAYYTTSGTLKPQIHEMAQVDEYVALGVVLADQALMLAGALQSKYCARAGGNCAIKSRCRSQYQGSW